MAVPLTESGNSYSRVAILLVVAVIGAVVILATYCVARLQSPLNRVPGPLYARFTHLPLKAAVISGRRIHHVHALHQQYGPFVRISPWEISVADATAYKQIHAVGTSFNKSPWYAEVSLPGIFQMADSKTHAARRRLLSRPFSKTHLRQHWEETVQEKVRLAVSRVRSESLHGPADVLKWFTFMASDVSTKLMFGEDFRTLEQGEVSDYIRTLQSAMMGSGIGVELPLLRWVGRRVPLQICRDLWCTDDMLLGYGNLAVANMKNSQGHTNIFANMLAEAEKGERLSDQDVRMEAQNLIIAGTDTTSVTLTYLIYAVLSRAQLQAQIEAEVQTLPDNFRNADVDGLEMLNAVIEETLRLYGAAPGALPRMVPEGGAVMGGFVLPEGTTVTTQAYTFHRDSSLFPDPHEFIPERWTSKSLGDRHRITESARAVYSPFGTGARTCLGIHLAYMELRLAAAEFFRTCPGACLAASATAKSMELENFFLVAPAGHRCDITLATDGLW